MREPGDTVARYTIVAVLGRGGMGEVYEAEDKLLERRVALKLLPAGGDAEARQRMLREARSAAAFEHPNAVTVYDAGVVGEGTPDEQAYIAMELVRGSTLRSFLGDPSVGVARRIGWLCDAAQALAAAHDAGLVHRDVKPDNVMVRRDGRVKVLDFGVAKKSDAPVDASAPTQAPKSTPNTLTERGSFVGTPRYASPEQLRGETLDGRTDQYAWAVTAYELLTGKTPFFEDEGVALVSKILTQAPPKLRAGAPELPREVEEVVLRAMAKDKADRFPSLRDAVLLLEPLAERGSPSEGGKTRAEPALTGASGTVVRTARGAARVFFWFAAGLGTLLIALIVVGIASGGFHLDLGTRGSASASASPAAAAPPVLRGLRCAPAKLVGPEDPDLARAIGVGVCARLGIATDLPWAHEGARPPKLDLEAFTPVEVTVTPGPKAVVIDVRVAGESTEATNATAFESMVSAVSQLAPRLAPRPLDEAERAAWGATSEDSARRIEQTWRRLLMGDLENPKVAIRALIQSDGSSGWPHAMACLVEARGGKASLEACKATLDRLGGLPPHREKALRAVALLIGENARSEEAVRLFRQAAQEAPDDPDVNGLYGAVVLQTAPEEGFGVIDGVAQRFPMYALLPLTNAVSGVQVRVPERNAKYLARLTEILPEKACDEIQFIDLLWSGETQEAARRLPSCKRLFGEDDTVFMSTLLAADVALAKLAPEEARRLAQSKLADARDDVRTAAMEAVAAAYLMGGKVAAGSEALENEMTRLRDQQNPRAAMQRAVALLRVRALLGEPLDPKLVATTRALLDEDTSAPAWIRTRVEAMLAGMGAIDRAAQTKLAEELAASKSSSDVFYAIPLLRSAWGDKKARAVLEGRTNVWARARVVNALELASLLRDTGASDAEVEAQYRLAMTAAAFDASALDKIVARLALARLLTRQGKKDEAKALRDAALGAFSGADPGVLDRIEKRVDKLEKR